MKRSYLKYLVVFTFFLIVIAIMNNPTKEDYATFSEQTYGKRQNSLNLTYELERVNFFVFSTYTPIVAYEHGVTHLGIMGRFVRISDGQFDYPWWLEFFDKKE